MLEDTIITEVEVDKRLNIMADWIKDGDQMELRFRGLRKLRFIQKWLENIERVVTADHTTTKLDKLAEWIKEMNVTGGLRDLERIHIIKKELKILEYRAGYIECWDAKLADMMHYDMLAMAPEDLPKIENSETGSVGRVIDR